MSKDFCSQNASRFSSVPGGAHGLPATRLEDLRRGLSASAPRTLPATQLGAARGLARLPKDSGEGWRSRMKWRKWVWGLLFKCIFLKIDLDLFRLRSRFVEVEDLEN